MRISPNIRSLIVLWAAWVLIVIGYQTIVQERYQPYRPDRATDWTPNETARNSQRDKPYLIDPFMNNQVSWDSEFYLSIATVAYDDPVVRSQETATGEVVSLNHAFFPLYPLAMRAVRAPFTLLDLTPIAASTLAGVLIAAVGTLGGMVALYDLTRDELGEAGGLRTAFYLLIFPTSFFLVQVYTEGLFIGLAFGSLALMRRRHLLIAGALAALATWTRSIGVLLLVPLAVSWAASLDWKALRAGQIRLAVLLRGLAVLAPVGAYLIWQALLGHPFNLIQDAWFGRGAFDMARFTNGVSYAVQQFLSGENSQMRVYFGIEGFAVILAVIACAFTLRCYPAITLFGLAAILIPLTSGAPQSLVRYMLAVPPLFIFLSRLGQRLWFDRAWTIFALLLMGMQTALFTFDMWVA